MRLIGLVNTMTLARLLTPQDFGVVAMATVFVGFIEIFSFMSFDLSLIRIQKPDKEHYDTAWTLQAIVGIFVSLLIVAVAPAAAWYFGEPRLAMVIRLMAANSLLQGLSNIGLVDFRRNLDFYRDLRFNVWSKLIVVITTISVAIFLRNYWALVTGLLIGSVGGLVLSYAMHPYRPSFRLTKTREILSFSTWMLLFHVGTYFRNRLDTIVVARMSAASSVGTYNVAYELSSMPTNELVIPTGRALFPAYAQLAHDPEALRTAFQHVIGFFFAVVAPLCTGMTIVAPDLVHVILGKQWLDAAPLVSMLTFAGGFNAISHVVGTFHAAHGRERFTATLTWINVAVLMPALFVGGTYWGIPGVARGRVLVSGVILALAMYSVAWTRVISGRDILLCLWRPAISALFMGAVLRIGHFKYDNPLLSLTVTSFVGVICFVAVYYGLWWACGRPPGVEASLNHSLRVSIQKMRRSSTEV